MGTNVKGILINIFGGILRCDVLAEGVVDPGDEDPVVERLRAEDLRLEAWIAEQRQRRLVAKATCHAGDTLTATATSSSSCRSM